MECRTRFEDSSDQLVCSKPTFIFDNPHTFCASDRMLYSDAERRNFTIVVFLFRGKRFTFRLFHGLHGTDTFRLVSLISGILIHNLAWHNGKRTDNDFLQLLDHMKGIPVSCYYTDDWGSYLRYLPKEKHVIGKDNTWKIERKNLNFRTHLKRLSRKTICYSKNEQIHDNVIGMYIERFYYKSGKYDYNGFEA